MKRHQDPLAVEPQVGAELSSRFQMGKEASAEPLNLLEQVLVRAFVAFGLCVRAHRK